LIKVIFVESTFNYYWLYDGCVEAGVPFYLGHAAYMKAIAGNKQKNDPLDAETIAHLMRSNLFPQAYPYPGEMRAVRDLLRRRHRLVRHRSEAYTYVQLLLRQQGICDFRGKDVKSVSGKQQILKSITDPDVYYLVNSDILLINQLDRLLSEKEKHIKERAYHHNRTDYSLLKSVTGIGDMLALSILYETQDVTRFPRVQNYASYCRVIRVSKNFGRQKQVRQKPKDGKSLSEMGIRSDSYPCPSIQ
jgi:transposase